MKIEFRPIKTGAMVIGEQCKECMIWHIVAFDEQGNEIDIILQNDQALELKKGLDRPDLRPEKHVKKG